MPRRDSGRPIKVVHRLMAPFARGDYLGVVLVLMEIYWPCGIVDSWRIYICNDIKRTSCSLRDTSFASKVLGSFLRVKYFNFALKKKILSYDDA